jgi:NadR type nicotinamide-nucleotide adenylyltransferase
MPTEKIIRIALMGPESSGKTTLAKSLAEHFNTIWIPEYAREYVENLNRPYTADDILFIAQKQLKSEEELLSKAKQLIFTDTELIIAKIWCEDVFDFCPQWILEKIEEKRYDLFLLTKPDLPWIHDPVRENAHRREYFYDLYLKELEERNFTYEIISGNDDQRFQNAVKAVKQFLDLD